MLLYAKQECMLRLISNRLHRANAQRFFAKTQRLTWGLSVFTDCGWWGTPATVQIHFIMAQLTLDVANSLIIH